MKFVFVPIKDIIVDIFRNKIIFVLIPDYTVVKIWLPAKIQSPTMRLLGYSRFHTANGLRQQCIEMASCLKIPEL